MTKHNFSNIYCLTTAFLCWIGGKNPERPEGETSRQRSGPANWDGQLLCPGPPEEKSGLLPGPGNTHDDWCWEYIKETCCWALTSCRSGGWPGHLLTHLLRKCAISVHGELWISQPWGGAWGGHRSEHFLCGLLYRKWVCQCWCRLWIHSGNLGV